MSASIAVFDVGAVLIDWDPRHLYRKLFDDDAVMERFLAEVCSPAWNLQQDAGRSFSIAVAELSERFPDQAELIRAYDERWQEMVPGAIDGSVGLLHELDAAGVPLYAITNFSVEKFALTRARFDFFERFLGIVVSGEVKLVKPDPAIYYRLLDDYGLAAADCLFIDDSAANVAAAAGVGMRAVQFSSPAQLRAALAAEGML